METPTVPHPLDELKDAERLMSSGRLDEAQTLYHTLLEEQTALAAASLTGLGQCARDRNARSESVEYFRRAAQLRPQEFYRWLWVADDLTVLGRYEEARPLFLRLLEQYPQDGGVNSGYGHCLRGLGNHEGALHHFLTAVADPPRYPGRLLDVAGELRQLGRAEQEAEILREVLALEPNNPRALINRITFARRYEGEREALVLCDEAVAKVPDDAWPHLEKSEVLLALNRVDEAQVQFSKALEREPGAVRALLGLGECARRAGKLDKSLEWASEATCRAPDDPRPWLELARARRDLGDYTGAREAAGEVLRRYPDHTDAIRSLAWTEYFAGETRTAYGLLRGLAQAVPQDVELLVDLAEFEKQLCLFDAFNSHLEEACAMAPLNPRVVSLKAEVLTAAGHIEEAAQLFRRAVDAWHDNVGLICGLADSLNRLGKSREAIDLLKTSEDRLGMNPDLRGRRIVIVRRRGDFEAALALARGAVAAVPENFMLAYERFCCEILVGDDAAVEESLEQMHPASTVEHAQLRFCRGQAHEHAGQLAEAEQDYAAAAELVPQNGEIADGLVRARLLMFRIDEAAEALQRSIEAQAGARRLRGQSLNISQSLFGQLLDEFRIDQSVLAQNQAAMARPLPERLQALQKIARNYPDNTSTGVAMLLAMREAGAFDSPIAPGEARIPRHLAQFWNRETPEDVLALMESWERHNFDWEVTRFDDATAEEYLRVHYGLKEVCAFRRAREPAMRADLFRLAWLVREGGIYADADDCCLNPLADWLDLSRSLILYQEDLGTIGNNFLAAAPGHPVLTEALHDATESINAGASDMVWLCTGPGLVTRALVKIMTLGAQMDCLPEGVQILPRRSVFPHVAMHCFASYKAGGKHWAQNNFTQGRASAHLVSQPATERKEHDLTNVR